MQITKITGESQQPVTEGKVVSAVELQREYGYYTAQKLLRKMLDKGLISVSEFDKISALNCKSLSPLLAKDALRIVHQSESGMGFCRTVL